MEPSTPALPDDLRYLQAVEALALFRQRKLSPVELMQAVIARAGQAPGVAADGKGLRRWR